VLLGTAVEPTWALVLSQVVLSLGIPFALVPMVVLNSDRTLMGTHTAGRALKIVSWLVVGLIVTLNVSLIVVAAS
jgi:manganese transport protein